MRVLPLLVMVPLAGCDGTGEWLRARAAAGAYAAPLASDTSVVTTRRVWSAAPATRQTLGIQMGAMMPDGNGVAAMDRESGDLVVFDLASREFRPFRLADESYDVGFADQPVVSPDGRQITFLWYVSQSQAHLRVVDVATGESRTIMAGDSVPASYISPAAWSPAGDSVFAWVYPPRGEDAPVELVLVPGAGGTPRVVYTVPENEATPWRVVPSPDGRWLLYEHGRTWSPQTRSDIYIVDVQGGGARPLVEHAGVDKLVGWLPGTDIVLFSSDRSGTTDLWSIRVVSGRAGAEPRLVRSGFFRSQAAGFGDGALFFSVSTGSYGLAVLNVDPQSGALLGAASAPLQHLNTFPRAQAWSPDGQRLAAPSPGRGLNAVAIHSMETGDSRMLWLDEDLRALVVEWAADGKSLFLRAAETSRDPVSGPHQFLRLDLVTAATTRLFTAEDAGEPPSIWRFLVTPDGRSILLRQRHTLDDGSTGMKLLLRSLKDGSERVLHSTAGFIPEFSLSADGTHLAFVQQVWEKSDSLFVMKMDGSQPLRFVASWDYDAVSLLGWLPAGSSLLASRLTADRTGEEVLRIGIDGSVTVVGMSPFRPMRGRPVQGAYRSRLVLSPAGNRLAHAVHDTGEELWRMDGLFELFARDNAGRR